MDPITLAIITAIATGVASGGAKTVEQAIVDAYNGLKSKIQSKFGANSSLSTAVNLVEANPESEGGKLFLKEQVAASKADLDQELVNLAKALSTQIAKLPDGEKHIQSVIGNYNAQADRGGQATVNVNQPHDEKKNQA
jgi:hypothetical protein